MLPGLTCTSRPTLRKQSMSSHGLDLRQVFTKKIMCAQIARDAWKCKAASAILVQIRRGAKMSVQGRWKSAAVLAVDIKDLQGGMIASTGRVARPLRSDLQLHCMQEARVQNRLACVPFNWPGLVALLSKYLPETG